MKGKEKMTTRRYRIIRYKRDGENQTIRSNVTEAEAQAHCQREDTRPEKQLSEAVNFPNHTP